ncbi:MAG: hypothetical protein ACXVD8_07880 [Actinomycetota bacterium]
MRRQARWGRRAAFLIVGLALAGIVGWSSSALLISDGLGRYSGDEFVAARHALRTTRAACSDRTGWPLVVPNLEVTKVDLRSGYADTPEGRLPKYRVEVRESTLFGIPFATTVVTTEDEKHYGEATCGF